MKRNPFKYILSLLMILSMAIFVLSCSTDSDSSEPQQIPIFVPPSSTDSNSSEPQTKKSEDKDKDKDKDKDNPENPDTTPDTPEIPQGIPLRAIEVVRLPTKTSYNVTLDESFSREGLSVKCIYDDGSKKECINYVLYHPNGNILHDGDIFTEEDAGAGAIRIRVSYSEKEETFETSFWIYVTYTIPEPEPVTIPEPEPVTIPEPEPVTIPEPEPVTIPEPEPVTIPEPDTVENLGYFWISKLPKTIYIVGDSLDLSGIKIDYYDQNNEWQEFTEEYTAEFYDLDTDISTPIPEQLSEGSFEVRITAKDGAITSCNTFSITVVTVKNISTFKHTNDGNSVTIGGFLDSGETKTTNFDYDAPYDAVESVSTDFEYKFIEGSTTDIVITGIKEERFPIITEVTIPATIDGYKVKQLAWDTFWPQWDDGLQYSRPSPIRTLIIEEGVESFTSRDFAKRYRRDEIMGSLLQYMTKLVLPKGFTLEAEDPGDYSLWNRCYHINAKGLKYLTLPSDLKCIDFCIRYTRIEELVIPESCTEILINYALSKNNSLKKVTFLGQTDINADFIFQDCPKLEELTLTGKIGEYSGEYQNLVGFTRGDAIKWTPIKKLTVKGTSSKLIVRGFDTLEEVIVDQTGIFELIVTNCPKLKKVEIGNIDSIYLRLTDCTELDTINFTGEKVPKIAIGDEAFVNTKIASFDYETINCIGRKAFAGSRVKSFTFHKGQDYDVYENAFCNLTELIFEDDCQIFDPYSDSARLERFANRTVINVFYSLFSNYYNRSYFSYDYASKSLPADSELFTLKTLDMSKAKFVNASFAGMKNLKTVIVGNSICTSSFEDCTSLEKVTVDKGICTSCFENCSRLKTINITDESIFLPCSLANTAISEVKIQTGFLSENVSQNDIQPNASFDHKSGGNIKSTAITRCRYGLLKGCKYLKKITFNTDVPSYLFGMEPDGSEENVTIYLEKIFGNNLGVLAPLSDYAFYKCKKLHDSSIVLTGDVHTDDLHISAGAHCFEGCESLVRPSVKYYVVSYTFAECKNLESIELFFYEGSEAKIYGTFKNCVNLVSVTSTIALNSFGEYAFYNCKNLESLPLPDSTENLEVGLTSFNGCKKILPLFKQKNLMFDGACFTFRDTGYLEENHTLTEKVYDLNGVAIHNLTIPRKTYPYIPTAFAENNQYLQTVTLDSEIEYRAFKGCSNLTTVKIGGTTFHTAHDDSFADCPKLTKIIVPAEYLEQYKSSSKWKKYWSLVCTE